MKTLSISVSFNQPVDSAIEECKKWEDKGYVVTETYADDFDCGQILELPQEDNDVMERHQKHMEICKAQKEWRIKHL